VPGRCDASAKYLVDNYPADWLAFLGLTSASEAVGEARGERRFVPRQGTLRFGLPDALVQARIDSITATDTLERPADRLITASSRDELLAEL